MTKYCIHFDRQDRAALNQHSHHFLPAGERKYYIDRNVMAASGTQTFVVAANSLEEAKKKFLNGESDIESSEVEVTRLDEYDFDEIYTD